MKRMDHDVALTDTDTYGEKTSHRALEMGEWHVARDILLAIWLVSSVIAWCAYPVGTEGRFWKAVGVGALPVFLLLFAVAWLFLITGERTRTTEVIIKPRHEGALAEHVVKETTSVELHIGKNQIVHAEIPGPFTAVIYWARAAWNEESLAYGAWQDQFKQKGRDKRVCYAEYRQWWVQAGHAREQGKEGLVILWDSDKNTKEFIKALAECDPSDPTPLLAREDVQKALEAPTHSHTHAQRLIAGGSDG